jgi:hypothetical protein
MAPIVLRHSVAISRGVCRAKKILSFARSHKPATPIYDAALD